MTPLFKMQGSIALCRGCRRVHEGTAGFAISHHEQCRHQRLFDALYRYERDVLGTEQRFYENQARADLVCALLGEP